MCTLIISISAKVCALNTFGKHLLVEYRGCLSDRLDDEALIKTLMMRAAEVAGSTVVNATFHRFVPQGVSGVVVIEESHLSIHTWPEHHYAAVDFYTCGDGSPDAAHRVLMEGLGATESEIMMVHRGTAMEGRSIIVKRHELSTSAQPEEIGDISS